MQAPFYCPKCEAEKNYMLMSDWASERICPDCTSQMRIIRREVAR